MLNESFYCENAPLRGHDHIVIDMCTFYNERKITLVIRHLGKEIFKCRRPFGPREFNRKLLKYY
jgi:ribosomal protein RSM22 (predicted rRNA methylase)